MKPNPPLILGIFLLPGFACRTASFESKQPGIDSGNAEVRPNLKPGLDPVGIPSIQEAGPMPASLPEALATPDPIGEERSESLH